MFLLLSMDFSFLPNIGFQNADLWPHLSMEASHSASHVLYDLFLLSKQILTCIQARPAGIQCFVFTHHSPIWPPLVSHVEDLIVSLLLSISTQKAWLISAWFWSVFYYDCSLSFQNPVMTSVWHIDYWPNLVSCKKSQKRVFLDAWQPFINTPLQSCCFHTIIVLIYSDIAQPLKYNLLRDHVINSIFFLKLTTLLERGSGLLSLLI